MNRRIALLAGGAALFMVAAAVIIVLAKFGGDTHSGGTSATSSASAGPSVPPPPRDQKYQVAAALRQLGRNPQDLVADEAKRVVAGHERQAVPRGSRVSPDVASWAPDHLGGGTMLVTVSSPGQPPITYAAVMVFEHHAWKVLATIPLQGTR